MLLGAGQRPRPQELGLLASIGLVQGPVYRRLSVRLLSSGAQLRVPDHGHPMTQYLHTLGLGGAPPLAVSWTHDSQSRLNAGAAA